MIPGVQGVEDRIELERALRERGEVGRLHEAALHNVRARLGAREIYGREDWIREETARFVQLGACRLGDAEGVSASLGSAATIIAARWRLEPARAPATQPAVEAPGLRIGAAVLCIARGGRIVQEWQYVERAAIARMRGDAPRDAARRAIGPRPTRGGIPWEYGELRAAPGQTSPRPEPDAIAPRAIAAHPLVQAWHLQWNLRTARAREAYDDAARIQRPGVDAFGIDRLEAATDAMLAPFADPVMYCERLVEDPTAGRAALQWRLVGRQVRDAWGEPASHHRLMLSGLSFFSLERGRIIAECTHWDELALSEQLLARAAS